MPVADDRELADPDAGEGRGEPGAEGEDAAEAGQHPHPAQADRAAADDAQERATVVGTVQDQGQGREHEGRDHHAEETQGQGQSLDDNGYNGYADGTNPAFEPQPLQLLQASPGAPPPVGRDGNALRAGAERERSYATSEEATRPGQVRAAGQELPRAPALSSLLVPLARRLAKKVARWTIAFCVCVLPLSFILLAHTLFLSPHTRPSSHAGVARLPNEDVAGASVEARHAFGRALRRSQAAMRPLQTEKEREARLGGHAAFGTPDTAETCKTTTLGTSPNAAAAAAADESHCDMDIAAPSENHAYILPFVACR